MKQLKYYPAALVLMLLFSQCVYTQPAGMQKATYYLLNGELENGIQLHCDYKGGTAQFTTPGTTFQGKFIRTAADPDCYIFKADTADLLLLFKQETLQPVLYWYRWNDETGFKDIAAAEAFAKDSTHTVYNTLVLLKDISAEKAKGFKPLTSITASDKSLLKRCMEQLMTKYNIPASMPADDSNGFVYLMALQNYYKALPLLMGYKPPAAIEDMRAFQE